MWRRSDCPEPATSIQTRQALPLLRELVAQDRLYWDPADRLELAAETLIARVACFTFAVSTSAAK